MIVSVYSILKKEKNSVCNGIFSEFEKMIGRYVKFEDKEVFTKDIKKAQSINEEMAKISYEKALELHLQEGYNVALNPNSKSIDSLQFAKLLEHKSKINFFIGGAYGFSDSFLSKCDACISLGKITLSHKVAKIVLFEQIFRGLTILNNHPYHK